MAYQIFQAKIFAKESTPRTYTVIAVPDGQKLVGVQLPSALKDQTPPLVGSMVLVIQLDAYRAYILMVLREPFDFLTSNEQYPGSIPTDTNDYKASFQAHSNALLDGEIRMESTGPAAPTGQLIPCFGASLYLGNNGVAKLEAGSMSEHLIIGGTTSDDDHEVLLVGNNGYFESNPTPVLNTQSTFNFTTNELTGLNEGLSVATQYVIPTGLPGVVPALPICELSMDMIGNLSLGNFIVGTGVPISSLTMDPLGNMSLQSLGTGGVASISLTGLTGEVNLNSGIFGVARLNDTTIADPTTDPAFWQFWFQQFAIFSILPVASDPGTTAALANGLKAAMITLLQTFPQSITGRISTASTSVKAGG
jgi:hypothetical protein